MARLGAACAFDLTELDETDNLHAPQGPLAEAQRLAAAAFGAEATHFLINGSTVGLQALILTASQADQPLLLSRSSHLSVFGGLILSGARPVYLGRGWDEAWELPAPPTLAELDLALAHHPAARAALVTRPDYFGGCSELAEIARALHARGAALLVDEAHGAHLGLDPRQPACALSQGADAVVQSTHKLLSAFTQASMLHTRGDRLDPARLKRMLRLLQSSSPSFLLLASLDAARRHRAARGEPEWARAIELAQEARARLAAHGIATLGADHGPPRAWDPSKLVVDLAETGHDGFAVARYLHDRCALQVELATPRYLGLIVGPAHRAQELEAFVSSLCAALRESTAPRFGLPALPPLPEAVLTPREAALGPSRTVPIEAALGTVSAELVCPYPPGLPVLVPGERVSREVLEYLHALRMLGADFVGPEDPGLETLQVCAPNRPLTRC